MAPVIRLEAWHPLAVEGLALVVLVAPLTQHALVMRVAHGRNPRARRAHRTRSRVWVP